MVVEFVRVAHAILQQGFRWQDDLADPKIQILKVFCRFRALLLGLPGPGNVNDSTVQEFEEPTTPPTLE